MHAPATGRDSLRSPGLIRVGSDVHGDGARVVACVRRAERATRRECDVVTSVWAVGRSAPEPNVVEPE